MTEATVYGSQEGPGKDPYSNLKGRGSQSTKQPFISRREDFHHWQCLPWVLCSLHWDLQACGLGSHSPLQVCVVPILLISPFFYEVDTRFRSPTYSTKGTDLHDHSEGQCISQETQELYLKRILVLKSASQSCLCCNISQFMEDVMNIIRLRSRIDDDTRNVSE